MKNLILLGDGMADWPLPDYGGRTPLEVAETPAMDALVAEGLLGEFCPIPEGMSPGSDVGNLSVFGYDPRTVFSGRAPIEAANQGIALKDQDIAFRCNLVTVEDGCMRDFTSGHISSEEGAELVGALNEALGTAFPIEFHPGVGYRHLAVLGACAEAPVEALVALQCEPPHNITGQGVEPYLPGGEAGAWVTAIMDRSKQILKDHPVNTRRIANGDLPATQIWLWGQGRSPRIEPYTTKFGITGAVISAVDLVKGIGRLAGLEVIDVPGATGWLDTNYEGKIGAALQALERSDFAYVHIEAPDETGHQGRADLKIQAIEDFDARIVAPAKSWLDTNPGNRILVAPDHFTTIETKTHAGGPVPFVLAGDGVESNGFLRYSEREAARTNICISEGYQLTEAMLRQPEIDFVP